MLVILKMNHLQLTLINGLNEIEIDGFKFCGSSIFHKDPFYQITCIRYTIKAKRNKAADYFIKS